MGKIKLYECIVYSAFHFESLSYYDFMFPYDVQIEMLLSRFYFILNDLT
jgi:hypothetical protein